MLLIPFGVDVPLRRRPYVNYALLAANVLVFLFVFPYGPGAQLARYSFALWTPGHPAFRPHQLLTYAFLHAGLLHLLGNMMLLWVFGNHLNDRLGHLGYASFYAFAALVSGLAQAAMAGPGTWCVGASGAVCAVVGGYLVLHPLNDVKLFYWVVFLAGVVYVRALWLIGFWALMDLMMALYAAGSRVAYPAHVAGYAMGMVTLLVLLKSGLLKREGLDLIAQLTGRLPDGTPARTGYIPVDAGAGQLVGVRGAAGHVAVRGVPGSAAAGFVDTEAMLRDELIHRVGVGDMATALGLYEQYTVANPEGALPLRVLVTMGNWYLRREQYSEAVEAWRRAVAAFPDHRLIPTILFSTGMVLGRHLGQPEAARAHLAVALPRLDDSDRARLARHEIARLRKVR